MDVTTYRVDGRRFDLTAEEAGGFSTALCCVDYVADYLETEGLIEVQYYVEEYGENMAFYELTELGEQLHKKYFRFNDRTKEHV